MKYRAIIGSVGSNPVDSIMIIDGTQPAKSQRVKRNDLTSRPGSSILLWERWP